MIFGVFAFIYVREAERRYAKEHKSFMYSTDSCPYFLLFFREYIYKKKYQI